MPPQKPIPSILLGRPFLATEALKAGLSLQVLRGKRFRHLFRGVYVGAEVPDTLETRVDAARLLVPGASLISHHTAAQLRGLPVPASQHVHVSTPSEVRAPRIAGVRSHEGSPTAVLRAGRRISAPIDNFVELAEELSLVDLVIVGDAMVRRRFLTCEELVAGVTSFGPKRGVRLARRAAALVRPRVDSPMETRLRLLIVLSGMPEPEPGFTVRDSDGGWIGEVDLAYSAYKIAIEYHGDIHRTKRGRWQSDVAKVELLRELDWLVVAVTAEDLEGRPERILVRLQKTLIKAGHGEIPSQLSSAWTQHLMPRWARQLAEPPEIVHLERGG